MKAIILDMYGVIVKQTGDDFAPYVKQTFPELTTKEIHQQWFRADMERYRLWMFGKHLVLSEIWNKLKRIIWIPLS